MGTKKKKKGQERESPHKVLLGVCEKKKPDVKRCHTPYWTVLWSRKSASPRNPQGDLVHTGGEKKGINIQNRIGGVRCQSRTPNDFGILGATGTAALQKKGGRLKGGW